MADEVIGGVVSPAPGTSPEAPPAAEAPAVPAVEPTAPLELPSNWDNDPRFRDLKSYVDKRLSKGVEEAVKGRDAQWAQWADQVTQKLEGYETQGLAPEQLAAYHENKRAADRQQYASQLQDLTLKMNVAAKYGIPLERVVSAQGVEGILDAVASYSNEKLAEFEKRLAAVEKPAARTFTKAGETKEPPKVASTQGTTAPKGATAEFQSLSREEQAKIMRNPSLLRDLFERAGTEK